MSPSVSEVAEEPLQDLLGPGVQRHLDVTQASLNVTLETGLAAPPAMDAGASASSAASVASQSASVASGPAPSQDPKGKQPLL